VAIIDDATSVLYKVPQESLGIFASFSADIAQSTVILALSCAMFVYYIFSLYIVTFFVSDIAIFVLKSDVRLQPTVTFQPSTQVYV